MSDDLPWRADHRLDETQAAALIAEQFPELAPVEATLLGEGWDGVVFLVNDAWAFRFPKRAEVEATHDRERALLAALAPSLPLAVPDARFLGRASAAFPLRFSGYRLIRGATADSAPPPADVRAAGGDLGRFLAAVHAFPVDEARRLGFVEWRDERWARNRAAAREVLGPAARLVDADFARRCEVFLDVESLVPDDYAGPPRFLHGDLFPEHVVVGDDGHPTGVIDWADACLGDPALDFAGAWQWAGAAMLDATIRAYGDVDDGAAGRARYVGLVASMHSLRYGVEAARPECAAWSVRSVERGLAELGL